MRAMDYFLLLTVVGWMAVVVFRFIKARKRFACGGGCSGCFMSGKCGKTCGRREVKP